MCGRYVLDWGEGDLLAGVELEEAYANFNVAPTTSVPILVDHRQEDGTWTRRIHAARWGLLPRWAKDEKFSYKSFNARSETAAEKPTFRDAMVSQHCAIPATGYYEWLKSSPDGKTPAKTPYYVHPPEQAESIYFAGLYDWWRIPEGPQEGQWLLSATILTMDAPSETDAALAESGAGTLEDLGRLHDRLPIPLDYRGTDDDGLSAWLRAGESPGVALERLRARAYDVASGWELRAVGPAVGNVANNGPELIEPATDQLF